MATIAAPAPVQKPGLLAPKEEKALYAYAVSGKASGLDPLVMNHPVYGQAAAALLGCQQFQAGNLEACVQQLSNVISGYSPIEANPFVVKYMPDFFYDLEIAGGVIVRLPLTNAALTLILAEALQDLQRGDEAIHYVEQLDPTYPALLSLTELYAERGDWNEMLRLTDRLPVDSEVTALLAILRSRAHLALGQLVAAKECLKPLISSKKHTENIRFKALVQRSSISLEEKAYGRAVADLEKILAENSQIRGVREAILAVEHAKQEAEEAKAASVAAKAAAAQQLREEKAAAAQRLREEKAAAALRLREEKAAAALRLREEKAAQKRAQLIQPVIQTGIISLSDGENTVERTQTDKQDSPIGSQEKAPGFYPDPEGVAPYRYWDGRGWTTRIRMTQ